jgi:hypothetical protein
MGGCDGCANEAIFSERSGLADFGGHGFRGRPGSDFDEMPIREAVMKIELHGFTITGIERRPVRITDENFVALCDRLENGTASDADLEEIEAILESGRIAA